MQPSGIVETCLYVDDVQASADWFEAVLGMDLVSQHPPRHAFLSCGSQMLLLFDPDETEDREPGDQAPAHGARGVQHVAFGVQSLAPWRDRLAEHGVEITAEADWGPGESIYFEDPDGNVLELVTTGLWPVW